MMTKQEERAAIEAAMSKFQGEPERLPDQEVKMRDYKLQTRFHSGAVQPSLRMVGSALNAMKKQTSIIQNFKSKERGDWVNSRRSLYEQKRRKLNWLKRQEHLTTI